MPDFDAAPLDRKALGGELAAAVREAGALALQKFRSPLKSWTKGNASIVSEVDIAVDELLRERLEREGFGWLSEESVDNPSRLAFRRVWIVDPIDGTRAFVGGLSDWAVSAALVEDGRPIIGALYEPVEDLLFLAIQGEGATLNGAPMRASEAANVKGARAAGPKRRLDALAELGVEMLPRVNSLALRLVRVAAGAVDIALAGPDSHDWDVVAADLVVHEAGGLLTDLEGIAPTYNRPDPVHAALVAAGRPRHQNLIPMLRERLAAFA